MQNENSKFKINKKFKKNILLKNYTTFKIGGRAKYFFEAKNKEDLIEAIKWAKENNLPFFVLAGGSNLLVADEGYSGLVINYQLSVINFNRQKDEIVAGGGTKLKDLVKLSAEQGLSGLEWLAGIPQATVGGAIHNNASAFGASMVDIVELVEVFDAADLKIKTLSKKDCRFAYKQTIFKKNSNLIILSCCLRLRQDSAIKVKEKINYVLNYRQKNHPMDLPSAGCIFENPSGAPAAELIDKAGLKGKRIGDAQISTKHANFIVNLGGATATDVLTLIDLTKKEVKGKFNISLREEIQYLSY